MQQLNNLLIKRSQNQTQQFMHRLDTQNRGIQSTENDDGTTSYSVGGKGALMQAFFSSQLDFGGNRKPGGASNYSTAVLESQNKAMTNALENNSNLTASQKEALGLQIQLNEAIQSANTNGDGNVSLQEWNQYIHNNADENGKLNFVC